jgi:hypothetical protein
MQMIRISIFIDAIDQSKAILTTIVKDLNLGISVYQALNVISAQKSNGISAEQAFKNLNSSRKVLPIDGKQTMTLDMARVYKWSHHGTV